MIPIAVQLLAVAPDADEARRWAEDELAQPIYDDAPSLTERLVEWIGGLLRGLGELGGSAPPLLVPLVVVAVAVVALVLARVLGGRVRRARRAGAGSAVVLEDARSSTELRAAADAAAARGDHVTAVLERFRAVVRDLDERGLLDERPGLTAHEAGGLAGAALPPLAPDLAGAADLFDAVRYGHAEARAEDDARLRDLADRVDRLARVTDRAADSATDSATDVAAPAGRRR